MVLRCGLCVGCLRGLGRSGFESRGRMFGLFFRGRGGIFIGKECRLDPSPQLEYAWVTDH